MSTKKRVNRTDITLRNLRALKKRIEKLEERTKWLDFFEPGRRALRKPKRSKRK